MAKRKGRKRSMHPAKLQPLAHQIEVDKEKKVAGNFKSGKVSKRERRMARRIRENLESQNHIDSKSSGRILNLAKQQREEIEVEDDLISVKSDQVGLLEEEDALLEEQADAFKELEISAEDQATMARLLGAATTPTKLNLGDMIMKKLKEREEAQQLAEESNSRFSQELIAVYRDVGTIMSKYRSGKVPKALKAIPSLENWEEVLSLCEVEVFSNQAMFVLTRLLASNLSEIECQKYYFAYLLPRVRWDIRESQKRTLNCHLFNALRKALFKPAAFFKGIVLPLVEDSQTTLREAVIVSSVLSSSSIPMLHSAASVLRIIQTCNGVKTFVLVAPGLVFLKALMNKKYHFPQRVVDELVGYFYSFIDCGENEVLPVLWHQCVLILLQRYRKSLSHEQKAMIRRLVKRHFHHQISVEIRRELLMADKESE